MIDAVIGGRLRGTVTVRTSESGHTYASWRMSATDKRGGGVLCACIAFSESVIRTMQAMSDGDALAVSGELAIGQWADRNTGEPRIGLDVTAHQVLSAYHQGRKRKAQEAGPNA